MSAFAPKAYQSRALESIEAYLQACRRNGNANTAFYQTTLELWGHGIGFRPIAGFSDDMPYFCVRVPTGGGKTWLAAKSVALANRHLLQTDYSIVLWLVPSTAIRDQTLNALKDARHPYRLALAEAGPVTVLDLEEAKTVSRATLETSTTVIITTRQAFQVGDTELRKVYASNGALMPHFDSLTSEQQAELEADDGGARPYSLANVLRLRRPFVIVDEAHNNRTGLSFETLARFRPSGILELTATPDTQTTPSNVLHSVSAAELKAEHMIKLPIRLQTEPRWQQCLADGIARRSELQALAEAEHRQGAAYLRPIVLIQAQARSQTQDTLNVDAVRQELINNHNVPPEEVVVATGSERGLEELVNEYPDGIFSPTCPVKYVVTQQALAEGWDCPFAYVLVSLANARSSTAVEQLLGRVLRQPGATPRGHPALNRSYAFVLSDDFAATAEGLRESLVKGAGFDRIEAADFVTAATQSQQIFDYRNTRRVVVQPIAVQVAEKPDLRRLPATLRGKCGWDAKKKTVTISAPLTEEETAALAQVATTEDAREALRLAGEHSRSPRFVEVFQAPSERGMSFIVPQLALRKGDQLELFDDPEQLDYEWELSTYDATPTHEELNRLNALFRVSVGGELDFDTERGVMTTRFMRDLQRDLGLAYKPENWDDVRLARWLCENLNEPRATHASKRAFVVGWLQGLLDGANFDLARANQSKFLIRTLLEERIAETRKQAAAAAWQSTLFPRDEASPAYVGDEYQFSFQPDAYSPNQDDLGEYGQYDFTHHFYPRIGRFDSKEEWECAVQLDQLAEAGQIQYWVRNLVRKEGCSFSLQKPDSRFYPDFVCQLVDGKVLVVEYKGADRWDTPDVKLSRQIGELWAAQSGGRCEFVMVKDRRWEWITEKLPEAG